MSWSECGKRDGADLALGDLPVMLEQRIAEPGGAGDDARSSLAHHLDRDDIEIIDGMQFELRCACAVHALARPAERLQNRHARSAEAALDQELRERGWPFAVGGQRQDPRVGMKMRAHPLALAF